MILSVGFLGSKLGPESTRLPVGQSLPFKMSCCFSLDWWRSCIPTPSTFPPPGGMGDPSGLPSGSDMTLAHRMTLSVVWNGKYLATEKLAGYLMMWFKIAGRHHILATPVVFSVDHFLKVGRADSCRCHRLLDALHGMCLWWGFSRHMWYIFKLWSWRRAQVANNASICHFGSWGCIPISTWFIIHI